MNHYEMVEKLRQKANVSYEDAKVALEACDWDMLDALILLESQGKVKDAVGGPEFTTQEPPKENQPEKRRNDFKSCARRFFDFVIKLLKKGNENSFVIVNRHHEELIAVPLTVLILLLVCIWPGTLIALIVGLFFGLRYSFRGPNMSQKMNDAMDKAADMAQGTDKKNE